MFGYWLVSLLNYWLVSLCRRCVKLLAGQSVSVDVLVIGWSVCVELLAGQSVSVDVLN